MTVRVREEAEIDLEEAASWYEAQQSGLGHQFLDQVLMALEDIGASPESFPVVYRQTRRALTRRFPFAVFYTIFESEVVVIAILHGSRSPGNWKSRMG